MENEKYSLEKAQEEAEKLRKKVESGEAPNYAEAEDLLESKKRKEFPFGNFVNKFIVPVNNLIPGIKLEGLQSIEEIIATPRERKEYNQSANDTGFLHTNIEAQNNKIFELGRSFFKDQIVVDLGAGTRWRGYELARRSGAKGYIAVEPHFAKDLYYGMGFDFKYFEQEHRDHLNSLIPFSIVAEDMLTFLKRLPDNSVSIIASGLDLEILPSYEHREAIMEEITRVLNKNGGMLNNWSELGSGLDPKKFNIFHLDEDERWSRTYYISKNPK